MDTSRVASEYQKQKLNLVLKDYSRKGFNKYLTDD
jgi:hypothetical protein